ncbi:MAG: hypothetical protein FJY85_19865 [Deltaproteobacteria bacterium]|nr:hypothetical protein [Deltaproteobacteria bacterium]
MECDGWRIGSFLAVLLALAMISGGVWAQGPLPMQPPVAPSPPGYQTTPRARPPVQREPQRPAQRPGAQPEGERLEYAFRPDLTNPEFGMCLQLEKNWRGLYERYYQLYHQARMMNPQDPQYAQFAYYLNTLKSQLDTTWYEFSSRCVYFPRR